MQITPKLLDSLRPQIVAALKSVHPDLEFSLGRCVYSATAVEYKLNMNVKGALNMKDDRAAKALKIYAPMDGIDVNKLGVWPLTGDQIKLVGYNTKKPKWRYTVENTKTGKQFLINEISAKRLFAKSEPLKVV